MLMIILTSKEPIWTFFKCTSILDKQTLKLPQCEINNNGETIYDKEGLKLIYDSKDLEILSVKFGEFINAFKFKSLYIYFSKDTVYRKVPSL